MEDKKGSQLGSVAPAPDDQVLIVDYSHSASRTVRLGDLAKGMPVATETDAGPVELAADGEATAGKAVQADDSRLSNARTPTAHAASHASAGGDPITPADIGAATTSALSAHEGRTDNPHGVTPAQIGALPASDYTAADVLAKLLTVDGAGSGLLAQDIDLGDGLTAVGQGQVGAPRAGFDGVSATNVDLNTLKEPGRYLVYATGQVNGPGLGAGFCIVERNALGNGSTIHQLFKACVSGRLAVRGSSDNGTTWSPWMPVAGGGYGDAATIGGMGPDELMPPGAVAFFARNTAPAGWLKCNGATVSRTTYADLFAAIGTTFGAGDGSTTFKVPDLRGEFVRGWDDARGVDAGRVLGSAQDHALERIQGSFGSASNLDGIASEASGAFALSGSTGRREGGTSSNNQQTVTFDSDLVTNSADETRPRNIALLPCIKY